MDDTRTSLALPSNLPFGLKMKSAEARRRELELEQAMDPYGVMYFGKSVALLMNLNFTTASIKQSSEH